MHELEDTSSYVPLLRRADVINNTKVTSNDQYQVQDFLGKGGFGECYSAENIYARNFVAIKVVSKSRLKDRQYQKIVREIRLHRCAHHENIVRMHDAFEDNNHFFMILELCRSKSLLQIINEEHQKRGRFDEIQGSRYVNQLCDAVIYLAKRGVLHRDIKPGNVFISMNNEVKLGDFGLAAQMEECTRGSVSGTPNYLAPEVICKEGHSLASEVWAIGCLIYCLLVGKPPFEADNVEATYERIRRGFYSYPASPEISASAKDLIQECLESYPQNRVPIYWIIDKMWLQTTRNGYPLMRAKSTGNVAVKDINGNVAQLPSRYHYRPKSATMNTNASFADRSRRKSITASHDSGFGSESDMFRNQCLAFQHTIEKVNRYISHLRGTLYGAFYLVPCRMPSVAITKWVDYSNRRGFGCKLSDGTIMIKFNEGACLSWPPESDFLLYLTQPYATPKILDASSTVSFAEKDHIDIAQDYAEYMDRELQGLDLETDYSQKPIEDSVYIIYHHLDSKHLVVLLSNGLLQITILESKLKMILWKEDDHRQIGVALLAKDLPPLAYRVFPRNLESFACHSPAAAPQRVYNYFEEVTSFIERDLPNICNSRAQVTSC